KSDLLQIDMVGSNTLGNRQSTHFIPPHCCAEATLADAAQLASHADETPEGRSIVVLAKEKYRLRERAVEKLGATFVAFTAQTRMSGVDLDGRQIRKGAPDAIEAHVTRLGGAVPAGIRAVIDRVQGWRDAA